MKHIALILFLIGIIASMMVLSERAKVEQQSRVVSIAIDYGEVDQIAAASHKSVSEVLESFKSAGANAVAIQEETIGDLIDNGAAAISMDRMGHYVLKILDKKRSRAIEERLCAAFAVSEPSENGSAIETANGKVFLNARIQHIRLLPAGMNPATAEQVNAAGMQVIARMVDYPGATKSYIQLAMSEAKALGAKTVIFAGDQALGFRELIEETGHIMERLGLNYGSVEFAKQKGDAKLSESNQKRLIRVHSITLPEMGIIDRPSAIERYARAVRERGIRLCYVRMFDFDSPDAVMENSDYIKLISDKIHYYGLTLGESKPIGDPEISNLVLGLVGIGSAGLFVALLASWFELSATAMLVWLIFSAVICFAAGFLGHPLLHKVLALGTAVTAPLYGLTLAASKRKQISDSINVTVIIWSMVLSIGVIAITALGGAITAALISSRPFLLKIDQFAGVKLAHIVPILIGAFAIASGIVWSPASLKEQKERIARNIDRIAKNPVLVWQAAVAFIILGSVAFLVARSGNEAGVGVSPIELKIRAMLDKLLYVRPRTKEFLVGHPALYLGIACLMAGKRNWAAPLMIIGIIGLVSLVNTFCHSHTPIALTIARTFVGAVVGLFIGFIVLLIAKRISGGSEK